MPIYLQKTFRNQPGLQAKTNNRYHRVVPTLRFIILAKPTIYRQVRIGLTAPPPRYIFCLKMAHHVGSAHFWLLFNEHCFALG